MELSLSLHRISLAAAGALEQSGDSGGGEKWWNAGISCRQSQQDLQGSHSTSQDFLTQQREDGEAIAEMRKAGGRAGRGGKTRHQLWMCWFQMSVGHCQGGGRGVRTDDIT